MFLACQSAWVPTNNLSYTPIGQWIDKHALPVTVLQNSLIISALFLTIISVCMLGIGFAGGSCFGLAGAPLIFNAHLIQLAGAASLILFATIEVIVNCVHKHQLRGHLSGAASP